MLSKIYVISVNGYFVGEWKALNLLSFTVYVIIVLFVNTTIQKTSEVTKEKHKIRGQRKKTE